MVLIIINWNMEITVTPYHRTIRIRGILENVFKCKPVLFLTLQALDNFQAPSPCIISLFHFNEGDFPSFTQEV